jgi:hypothetical protein
VRGAFTLVTRMPARDPAYRPAHPSADVRRCWPSGDACRAHQHERRAGLLSIVGVKDDQLVRRVGHSGRVSNEGFRRGQHVTVEIDGERVDGVFDRQAERHDGIDPEAVPGGDISTVGWVRRSDTGEIEGFLYSDIESKPEADVRIAIGKGVRGHAERAPDCRRSVG